MTHIVSGYPSKKAMKEAITAGKNVYADDPSMFNPRSLYVQDLKEGESITCTNHPKRSWFARIERKNGFLKVT